MENGHLFLRQIGKSCKTDIVKTIPDFVIAKE